MAKTTREKCIRTGMDWFMYETGEEMLDFDVDDITGKFVGELNIDRTHYETDPYSRKDYALSDLKGYLEGVKAQIESTIHLIDKKIEEIDLKEK